jgi:hypothetical protein
MQFFIDYILPGTFLVLIWGMFMQKDPDND